MVSAFEMTIRLNTRKQYTKHMRTHDPSLAQICEKCGKTFKNKQNALKHDRTHHSDFKPEPQQCTVCKAWYSSRANLRYHMRNVHDSTGKEHRCSICDHVSTTQKALKTHILNRHKRKEIYKCTMCDKTCNRALYLKEHMATHTGEALYACPHCPVTFTHNANWYKHLQNVHKAEYAAYKQQKTPPSILKIAKTASEKIRNQKSLRDLPINSSSEGLVVSSKIVVAVNNNTTEGI